MDKFKKYAKVFAEKTKDFDENSVLQTNIAGMETLNPYSHKLIAKEDFSLPDDVAEELKPLKIADLCDFEKELCKK